MKKILIINANSIYNNNATGITLRSFMESYNSDSLLELYWDGNEYKDTKISSYKLKYHSFSLATYLLKLKKSNINKNLKIEKNPNLSIVSYRKRLLSQIRQFLALVPDTSRLIISRNVEKKIENFQPDVIYTLGASVNALKLSYKLSKKYKIPIVIHHMDNWLHSIQWESNPLLKLYVKKLRYNASLCNSRTTRGIAISSKMAEDFTKETGIYHEIMMNAIDMDTFKLDEKQNKLNNNFKIIYAGGLHLNRNFALEEIAKAIEDVNNNSLEKIEFNIYTSDFHNNDYKEQFSKYPSTFIKKAVSHDKILKLYQNANALVHVESGNLLGNEFFKYSISTKIPEYLTIGKPILLFCPSELYLSQFMKKNKIAFVTSEKEELKTEILNILSLSDEEQITISKNNFIYAKQHFSQENAKSTFIKVMDEVTLP